MMCRNRGRTLCLLFMATSMLTPVTSTLAQERWRQVADMRWDTRTIVRSGSTVLFWYEAPMLQAQRQHLYKFEDRATVNRMAVGRYRVKVDCSSRKFAVREVVYLDKKMTPVGPPTKVPEDDWDDIAPETSMEALADEVC